MNTIRTLALGITLLVAIFLATSCRDDAPPVSPDPLSALDTTSHEFVWDFDTIGIQFSGITSVAAVSANDVWVTGGFFRHDEMGKPDPKPIGNAAHWNGKEWTMHGFNSRGDSSWYMLDNAHTCGPNNVWICGGSPFQWDGAKWTTHRYTNNETFGSGIIDTWSTKNADYVCVVGLNQSCAYYRKDDGVFTKVRIPFVEDCLDVTGMEDGTMYVAAGNEKTGHIYKVTPDRQVAEYFQFKEGEPRTLWIQNGKVHFGAKHNIYRLDDSGNQRTAVPIFQTELHVLEEDHETENNMFFMLQRGNFLHWNGSTWKQTLIPYPGEFWAHDMNVVGRDVYFVGFGTGQFCVIAHGRQL